VGQDVAMLRQLVVQHGAVALAVGLPLDLEGREGSAVAGVRLYAQQLTKATDVRPLSLHLAQMVACRATSSIIDVSAVRAARRTGCRTH
jgi:RNase H-fold protein (predicted Holliday junction resolvase)